MYKLIVFTAVLAVAAAAPGLIGSPLSPYGASIASPWGLGHGLVGSPLLGGQLVGSPLVGSSLVGGSLVGSPLLGNPYVGNPLLGGHLVGGHLVGGPVLKTALPVATSYANTLRIASPVVAAPVAHSPLISPW